MVATARYHRMDPIYWQRARAWDERTRCLGAYLRTGRHRTGEGLYALPVAYMAEDMNWTNAIVLKSLRVLENAAELHYDAHRGVVLIPDALALQTPTTDNQIKGAVARIRMVPVSPLLAVFYQLAVTHSNGLAEAMAKDLHAELDQAMAMETQSHSNGNGGRIAMGGSAVGDKPFAYKSPSKTQEP